MVHLLFDLPHQVDSYYSFPTEIDLEKVRERIASERRLIVSINDEVVSVDLPLGPHTLAPLQQVTHQLPKDHPFLTSTSKGVGYMYGLFSGKIPGAEEVISDLYFLQPPLRLKYDHTSVKKVPSWFDALGKITGEMADQLLEQLDGFLSPKNGLDEFFSQWVPGKPTDIVTWTQVETSYHNWCDITTQTPISSQELLARANEYFRSNLDWDNQWYSWKLLMD
ncbi:MAG: hypothetical protein ACYCQJ_14495 [Nitrososphaerales archaeon]